MKVFLFLTSVLLAVHFGRTDPIGLCPSDNGANDVLLPDSDNCAIFYQCDWGEYVPKRCAASLHFDTLTLECDYPENVNCNRDSGVVEPTTESEDVEATTEPIVVGGPIGSCPAENPDDRDVLLPDSLNCAVFYKCDWGEPVLQLCPDDLVFDTSLEVCTWKENVNCDRSVVTTEDPAITTEDSGSVPDPLFDCPETEALYIPDKTDCTKYYVCVYGTPVEFTCPEGLHYDGTLWACNYPDQVICGQYDVPDDNSETSTDGSGSSGSGGVAIGPCPAENGEIDVLLPDSEDCSIFYKCDWGVPVIQECPEGLLFNTVTDTCDWADSVDCSRDSDGSVGSTTTEDAGSVPDPLFDCPETEALYIPDKTDCTKYYVCVYGTPVEFKCPEGLHYDGKLWTCNYPDQVICGQYDVPDDSSETSTDGGGSPGSGGGAIGSCPAENGEVDVLLPDSEDCSLFYKCDWGEPVIQECPEGLLFNTVIGTCDWADSVDCNRDSDGSVGSTTTEDAGSVPDPLFDCPETEALYIPDKTDCTKYYVCVYGTPVEFKCPEGLHYDGTLWTCNYPDQVICGQYDVPDDSSETSTDGGGSPGSGGGAIGSCPAENGEVDVLLPDSEDCSLFYKCDWGVPVIQECPDGLLFNTVTDTCDWADSVDCNRDSDGSVGITSTEGAVSVPDPLFDCPETEALYIPDKTDCTKYYVCVYGTPVEFKCPEGLHYDGTLWTCNYPDQVICGQYDVPGDSSETSSEGGGSSGSGVSPVGECPAENGDVDVLLPDEDNCAIFYKCDWGVPVAIACQDGLLFNTVNNQCDWPENVDCDRSNVGDVDDESNENGGGDIIGAGPVGECPAENGEVDVLLPDEENCGIFYKCDWGVPVAIACQDGLLFNTVNNQCDWPENVDCDRSINEGGEEVPVDSEEEGSNEVGGGEDGWVGDCPEEVSDVDVYLASKDDPHKFYVCVGVTPVELECPSDLVFDFSLQRCEYA